MIALLAAVDAPSHLEAVHDLNKQVNEIDLKFGTKKEKELIIPDDGAFFLSFFFLPFIYGNTLLYWLCRLLT